MPTPAEVYDLLPVAQYLASDYVAKKKFQFGKTFDDRLPIFLFVEGKIFRKIYSLDPTYSGLQVAADYLYEAMGRFGLGASYVITNGGGGSIAPISPLSPFVMGKYLVEVNGGVPDFANATDYDDPDIAGKNLVVFWNDIPRFLIPGTEWAYTLTGIRILIGGFDATVNNYNFKIFIKNPFGTSGTGTEVTRYLQYTGVTGTETSITASLLSGASIVEVIRGTPYTLINSGTPTGLEALVNLNVDNLSNGTIDFDATNPIGVGEVVTIVFSKSV